MNIAVTIAVALVGLAVGSFVCVIIDRLPIERDEPAKTGEVWTTRPWREVVGGTSRCSSCGAGVRPYDNIPVLGWLMLRGRCRDCSERIPGFHPLVELVVPALAVLMYWRIGETWPLLPALWMVPLSVALAVVDLRTMIVPTRLVWPAFFGAVITSVVAALAASEPGWLVSALFGVLVAAGPLFVIWFIMPSGMGFGDVRLAVFLGWNVGFAAGVVDTRILVAVMATVLLMTVGAFGGILLAGILRVGFGIQLPFGPSLVLAALAMVAFAQPILEPFTT